MDETKPSQVVFYNWTDYLAPEIAKGFEKESGIKVQESYFSTNEEMLAKFKAGATGYDVAVPSDWMVSVMTKSGLLEELDTATAKMIEQKPLVATYDSVNQKRAIAQGQYLTHCWDGDALMAIDVLEGDEQAKQLVDFVRPTEGFYTWIDNMVCPIGNGSRYGAHLWMDYLMDPKVAGANASWVWYLSAVAPASWEYTDPFALSLKPTDEELARAEVSVDVGGFQRAYDEAWRQIKSA